MSGDADLVTFAGTLDDPDLPLLDLSDLEAAEARDDDAVSGHERILYGSRFPDAPIAPQLYELHRCGLTQPALAAICSGNLDRLLRID